MRELLDWAERYHQSQLARSDYFSAGYELRVAAHRVPLQLENQRDAYVIWNGNKHRHVNFVFIFHMT